MSRHVRTWMTAIAGALLIGAAAAQDTFYSSSSNIELLVAAGTGGGGDTMARFVAPYLSQHTPGNPNIIINNVPGGGSLLGSNQFALQTPSDGLHMWQGFGSNVFPYVLGQAGVMYDIADYQAIVGEATGAVVYVSAATGIQTAADLLDSDVQLVFAGQNAAGFDLGTILSFELLGIDVQSVIGYGGRGPARVAWESGESNINYDSGPPYLTFVQPLIDEGQAYALYTVGLIDDAGNLVRDPVFPDLPTTAEVYEELYGEPPSGEVWEAYKTIIGLFAIFRTFWVKADVPEEALAALREGSRSMVQDPEFLAEREELFGTYPIFDGEYVQATFDTVMSVDPATIAWIQNYLTENFDVQF